MKRPDLLILIAVWRFIAAFMLAVGVVAIAVFAFPEAVRDADTGAFFGLSIGIVVLLALIGLSAAAGIGLIGGKSWGRTLAIVNAVLDLLSIPFGTIIGILTLIYLFRQDVKEYFAASPG